ncbi:MAG: alpha/beta hydrolase fold domain-containing protein [Actinomycetota bacterium]
MSEQFDMVIVGAGFAGMYQLVRARRSGLNAVVLEAADDVGGTWYWNRYPGARCDILTVDYSYSWDPELQDEWTWSERYATQPEILRYAQFVADKHDLRRDIRFGTRVAGATWSDDTNTWTITTEAGDELTAPYYVMATGCLSVPKTPDVAGIDNFEGDVYSTSTWPHDGVDFTGKKVAVIGTGSSAIQSIPLIAEQADHLTVLQRTPNFSIPAHNGPISEERMAEYEADREAYREEARHSQIGVPNEPGNVGALDVTEAERNAAYQAAWEQGELVGYGAGFTDLQTNPDANQTLVDFLHDKIRSIVDDPEVAEILCPTNHYVLTKRPCLDTDYYATFNRDNVDLVDLRAAPISTVTAAGITFDGADDLDVDAIVLATGFDAMTGAIVSVDIAGRDGVTLKEAWADGPHTYLGLMAVGFPNLFMITGPQSPSVLSNMMVSIEQHVDWIADTIDHLRADGFATIEPTQQAQDHWVGHVNTFASLTLMPTANSWYMGANVPGKPQVFLPYLGGVGRYRETCDEVVTRDYIGFTRTGEVRTVNHNGLIRPLQPDVMLVLEAMAELGLPPIESMSPAEARGFMEAAAAQSPPGPEVGEIVDGTLPGPDSELEYRLYRPPTDGPHPIVAYFHGGGWVLGSHTSDDPLCRDLCVRSNCVIVSVNYRHAPEATFPAAADDGLAAAQWIAEHQDELGGNGAPIVVAGWSAGGNVAAVTAQRARDEGGPEIAGQVLLCPVVDTDMDRPSHHENAEGYVLTRTMLQWFFDNYTDPADRAHPHVAPIRGNLADLPPALVVTCEFDPLRDEGAAYVAALTEAGNDARLLAVDGHTHTSIGAVDMVLTGEWVREEMATALRDFAAAPVPA